jgi:hypothetical protein
MRKSAGPMKLRSGDRLKRLAHECVAVADWVDNVEISSELQARDPRHRRHILRGAGIGSACQGDGKRRGGSAMGVYDHSASRARIAGLSGFLTLSQSVERPDR